MINFKSWNLPEEVFISELPDNIFSDVSIQKNHGNQLVFHTEWRIVIDSYGDFDVVRNYLIDKINTFDRSFTFDGINYELFYEIADDGDLYPQLNLTCQGSLNPLLTEEEFNIINEIITDMVQDLESLYKDQSLDNEYYFVNVK